MLSIRSVVLMLAMILGLLAGPPTWGQTLTDYTATPPFIPNAVPPNVLILMDNSGSMNQVAYADAFDPGKTYYGIFDPLECYSYNSNKFIPNPDANPTSPDVCPNSSYPWSGNLMNYGTMRRVDIVKWAMMGGICSVGGRDAQGNCRQLIAQPTFDTNACCLDDRRSVPVSQANGRLPASVIPGSGNVYFYLMGSIGTLKGGVCLDNDAGWPTQNSGCNDTDGVPEYTETLWQLRVDHFENATGVLQQVGSKARFGLMQFKGSGDGGKVLSDVGGNLQSLITQVEGTTPSTWTPLAESLYEASRYYAQIPPAYTNSDYSYNTTSRDPYYFTQPNWSPTSRYVDCCRSFVIVFTDGEPTQDQNIPDVLKDYGHPHHGTHCTSANIDDLCAGHKTNYDDNGSHYLDDVAFYAHTTDLRQATLPLINVPGKDRPGFQNLTVYTFYAFGGATGREILQTTAKLGGFEDRNGNQQPDLTEEWDRVNNLTGAVGADGIPDTYFESSNADTLRDRLMSAITSILQRSASGTAVSVLANSSNGEGAVYQSYFYPTTFEGLDELKWLGYTQALFLDSYGNLREDTDGDGRLVYSVDKIIKTRYETNQQSGSYRQVVIDRYDDANGDGQADSSTPSSTGNPLRETQYLWEAGVRLANQDPSSRTLRTWLDLNNNGLVEDGEELDFTTANAATLTPFLNVSGTGAMTATNLISFIRGEAVSGLRSRELAVPAGSPTKKTWKLGDTIHANPTVVEAPADRFDLLYGDASYLEYYRTYKNRRRVVYVGANDGMLHAFNAGFYHRNDDPSTANMVEHGWFTTTPTDNNGGPALGEELWGYLPYQLLPQLQWLARADYTHVYYVDLTPQVSDVRIFTPDATHPNGWGTILIGGFRLGGSCNACTSSTGAPALSLTKNFGNGGTETRVFYSAYFVLDITDPERPPRLLWSFSDPGLGLTLNRPSVIRLSPVSSAKTEATNAVWYAVFPSGPTGYDGSAAQPPSLYAINLADGPGSNNTNVTRVLGDTMNGFFTEPVGIDANLDYRVERLYIGSTLNDGSGPWRGKLSRLSLACDSAPCTPQSWGIQSGSSRVTTELLNLFPSSQPLELGPVTAKPTLGLDDTNHLWVFVGTGRYFTAADKVTTDPQYLLGVKDPVHDGRCVESTITGCLAPNLIDVSAAQVCVVCGSGTQELTGVSGATTVQALAGLIQSKDGWYVTLPHSRERITTAATLFGGAVFVPTFAPLDDLCSAVGESYLYGLFYLTGSPNRDPILYQQSSNGGNVIASPYLSLGDGGMGSTVTIHLGRTGNGTTGGTTGGTGCQSGMTGFMQTSSGAVSQLCVKPPLSTWSRYISWINQRD